MRNLRWVIAALLFGETILNYLDMQSLAVLAPELSKQIGLTDVQYARVGEAFQLAYLLSFLVGGWIIDRVGVRWGLTISMIWWSAAAVAHAWAMTADQLALCRFLLGLGYPGAYLAAAKAASEWFPPQERGLVTGIYTSGATVGATVAPPLVARLALTWSWQTAFIVTGGAGLVYAVLWFAIYRTPRSHPWISAAELAYIQKHKNEGRQAIQSSWKRDLPLLVRSRYFWAIVLGRMIGDTPWIFYVWWIPKYLSDTQGLDLKAIGYVAWVPFLFADIGSLGGGWLSGRFVRKRGIAPVESRMRVMRVCAAITSLTFLIYYLPSTATVVGVMSVMVLATAAWMVNLSTVAVDVFPAQIVGTAVGLTTVGAVLGQLVFTHFIGKIVQEHSYDPLFFIMSVLTPTAYGIIRLILRSRPQPASADGK